MFATGAVHAMITSSATGMSTKAWEFVKNYYNTSAFHPKNVVVVNQRGFSRLPKNQQDALVKSATAAEKRGWEFSKAREKEANETLAKNGMTLHEPDAAMKDAFTKIGQQMAAEWEKTAGADGQAILKAYRGK
jgi:TRAP-type C4-dicarboxylate transport system substrate-binding protein